MKAVKPLTPKELYRHCDQKLFDFESTAELEDMESIPGQERAVEAIHFGMEMEPDGFNLFVLGLPGTGRHVFVRRILEQKAATKSTADDWCYVNNFDDPQKPRALRLPAGKGNEFRKDIEQFIQDAHTAIPAALESEEFQTKQQAIEEEFKEEQTMAMEEIQAHAKELKIRIIETPTGFTFTPIPNGEAIKSDEFEQLPEKEKKRIQQAIEILTNELSRILQSTPKRLHRMHRKSRELEREVAMLALSGLIDELAEKYKDLHTVMEHLQRLQSDIVDQVDLFHSLQGQQKQSLKALLEGQSIEGQAEESVVKRRYGVNVIIDHSEDKVAPVIFEDHPTFSHLIGRIEHQARIGVLITDFHLIRAGALHRANGGYLVLDIRNILMQPLAWEGLKRALKSREVRIRSLGEDLSLVSTVSLEPEPIPLDIKVVLLGERLLYYLLQIYDPEFPELFKVAADFEDEIDRTEENSQQFARLVANLARQDSLKPLDRSAMARLLEESARHAGDAEKLSAQIRYVADIVREAHYWAKRNEKELIGRQEVQLAIDARVRRASRIRDRVQEEIQRDSILIDTEGAVCGQLNGLSVLQIGDFAFGRPSRITARVALGSGKIIDIEREVELGGPIHSKGVLILSSFLASHYVPDQPLSLHASLVFEQSYGEVEGDSASAAELCALLSALAETPIEQALAITGSVNQFGRIQPIGGVNEKIEGFFDVCNRRGLNGRQGVLIPLSNVKHLMLRRDVIEAVKNDRFHVYPVETIDQCLELLTGLPAGERDEQGNFPEGSVNLRVRARLIGFVEKSMAFSGKGSPGDDS